MDNVKVSGIKIAFLGTPEFAVPILDKLANSDFKPITVFCAPDKPVGRKQIMTSPPVKTLAQKYNIPVFQPADKKELNRKLLAISHSLIITAAYGLILTQETLNIPQYGCLNIHPSLLPKYRGPSPIQNTILRGDTETGVTIMKMALGVDAGPIIANGKLLIANSKIMASELSQKLSLLGADLLLKILPDYLIGKIIPRPQDESQATDTKIIKKEDGRINWQNSAETIERQIRAYAPWPGSHTQIANGQSLIIKILESDILKENSSKPSGTIFITDNNQIAVQTSTGALIIKKLQLEGGRPLSAKEFLRGHQNIIGRQFT